MESSLNGALAPGRKPKADWDGEEGQEGAVACSEDDGEGQEGADLHSGDGGEGQEGVVARSEETQ